MTDAQRFKANIRMVELEMHSYCNRQCWFCPNQFIDRQGPVQWLDEFVLGQVLNDLAFIDYDNIITFSGNCEPFSQGMEFVGRVKYVRKNLPNAFLMTNTNTDYLNTELVEQTAQAGMDVIKAQLYFDKDEEFTREAICEKYIKLANKLPGIKFIEPIPGQFYARINGMIIHAYAKDWHKVGHNRCDVSVRKPQKRMLTCGEPVQYIGINYNGIVTPCCNLRSDYGPHEGTMLGKIDATTGKLFSLYQGLLLPEDEYPCQICEGKSWHANGKLVYQDIAKSLDTMEQKNGE
jgi:MoaA/NifB/PqqE/SkfB family radical SAM enzyme